MKMKTTLLLGALAAASVAAAADAILINGAGATFPFPLYSKWFSEYNRIHPELKFNYQSIGSGGGIQQITNRTVDFGASDAPMSDAELTKAPDVVHIPTVLGSVVLAYQVPGMEDLRLSAQTASGIFLGKIQKWNDPAIAQENPGASLPDLAIAVIHRSDGSGTTAVFTDYLAKVSSEWKSKVGAGKSVKWPTGLGAKGNEGVTGMVRQTPGSIGYVELAYADQNHLPMAQLKNAAGLFVKPSVASTSAAAEGVNLPEDFRTSITNPPGKQAYPIASFTYLLVRKDQADQQKGEALIRFLGWAIQEGQKLAPGLDYAPLPEPVVAKVNEKLTSLTVQGKPISIGAAR